MDSIFFGQTFLGYQTARDSELAGRGKVISGTVAKVTDVGDPGSGAHSGVFRVDGVLIADSKDILRPGFHLFKAYGSTILPKANVRLTLVGNDIVKAENCQTTK